MAATPQELQDFQDVLKTVYLPVRRKLFPRMTPVLAAARRGGPNTVTYGGNDLVFDVKVERRGGFSASAKGFLPEAKNAREKQGRLSIARTYARSALDGLALKANSRKKDGFISTAAKVTEDIMEQWQFEQSRIIHSDSLAIRAVVDTVTDTTHIIVDNPYGITGAGPGNLHLVVGDDIAVLTSAGVQRGKASITDISLSGDAATLTLSAAIASMQAGDIVVSAPPTAISSSDNSWGAEPYGLKAIIDVEDAFTTFEGITDDRWVAQKITSTSVDEKVVMRLLNTIRARAGVEWRGNPSAMLLLTTTGIWQAYGDTLLGIRRYDAPTMTIEGGFTATKVAGAALLDDPWCPRGRLYAIHGPDLIFVDLMDFGELSYQDAPTWSRSTDRDAWEAAYGAYWNFGVTRRHSHGVISGITDTVNYSPVF